MKEFRVTIGENGRMLLPTQVRKKLNISRGDHIMLVLNNEELKLITLKSAVKNFQQFIKDRNKSGISLIESLKQSRTEDFKNE